MIILKVFLLLICIGFNLSWYKESKKDNGNFDKKEIVQWMLGNLSLCLFWVRFGMLIEFSDWTWGIILGSLVGSVGIQFYTDTLKNEKVTKNNTSL